jgi:uncharacterized protein
LIRSEVAVKERTSCTFLVNTGIGQERVSRTRLGNRRVRSRIVTFIAIMQGTLLLAHWFLYETLASFLELTPNLQPHALWTLRIATAVLSISFVSASLLAFRSANILVRLLYTLAAMWLGTLTYLFMAACTLWVVYGVSSVAGVPLNHTYLAASLFGTALLVSAYGIINASWTRVTRVTIPLRNLPQAWSGRVAALVSDTHLGHVRNYSFTKRLAGKVARLQPDVVFLAGDVFDGTKADLERLAQPWLQVQPPQGIYFSTGNHEEFTDPAKYLTALRRAGVRILNNEKVVIDGLQIVGIHYRDSANPQLFRAILRRSALDRERASILITHAPDRPAIAEEEGVSLQLSGHTHGGQFFPFTLVASRAYGPFVHGLSRLGKMWVFTNWGAGTWGPPLRVGTKPEIVLIRFESAE